MKVKVPGSKPAAPAGDWAHQHVVAQGDTLWKLAKAWGISLSDMIKANPQLKNPNALMTGEIVNIPKAAAEAGDPAVMPELKELSGHGNPDKIYTGPAVDQLPTAPKLPEAKLPEVEIKPQAYQVEHQVHIDLFKQFKVPAAEVMFELPKVPEVKEAATCPEHVKPAEPPVCPPGTVPVLYPCPPGTVPVAGWGYHGEQAGITPQGPGGIFPYQHTPEPGVWPGAHGSPAPAAAWPSHPAHAGCSGMQSGPYGQHGPYGQPVQYGQQGMLPGGMTEWPVPGMEMQPGMMMPQPPQSFAPGMMPPGFPGGWTPDGLPAAGGMASVHGAGYPGMTGPGAGVPPVFTGAGNPGFGFQGTAGVPFMMPAGSIYPGMGNMEQPSDRGSNHKGDEEADTAPADVVKKPARASSRKQPGKASVRSVKKESDTKKAAGKKRGRGPWINQ
ncbi:LysM peptidoglycan-binding domain-containing protein [Paenibacillus tarimensis]|nr:LysM peptidoglycan-binding domain-containing protein [Paenibacillus tarimensis]